jgi:hypothetical protein
MHLEQPDRVPVMCQFSIGFMNQQLGEIGITPMELWLDAERYAEALLWLRERFDFDGILVSIHGHDPDWRDKLHDLEIVDGIERATFPDRVETYVDDDLPVGKFFESRARHLEEVDPESIPESLDYIPSSRDCYIFLSDSDPYRVFDLLAEKTDGRYSLHGEVTSPLDYFLDLLGYEKGLMAMMDDPEKVLAILERFTVGVIEMARGLSRQESVDAIKISSPFAGMGFISPAFYRTFELPFIARIAEAVRAEGASVYVHTCGHIHDRLEIMAESGLSGLECLDPPPMGNVDLDDAFRRIGNSMFIKGNIDSVHTLLFGTDEAIRRDVERCLRIGMQNPGFILSTACSIAPPVTKEHVQLVSMTCREEGIYRR